MSAEPNKNAGPEEAICARQMAHFVNLFEVRLRNVLSLLTEDSKGKPRKSVPTGQEDEAGAKSLLLEMKRATGQLSEQKVLAKFLSRLVAASGVKGEFETVCSNFWEWAEEILLKAVTFLEEMRPMRPVEKGEIEGIERVLNEVPRFHLYAADVCQFGNPQRPEAIEIAKRYLPTPSAPPLATGAVPPPHFPTDDAVAGHRTSSPCCERALAQYLETVKRHSELSGSTDWEVYKQLRLDEDDVTVHDGNKEEQKRFATWVRYVRRARKAHGLNKHSARTGRETGRSVVSADEI